VWRDLSWHNNIYYYCSSPPLYCTLVCRLVDMTKALLPYCIHGCCV
jgi:hypothetical protein